MKNTLGQIIASWGESKTEGVQIDFTPTEDVVLVQLEVTNNRGGYVSNGEIPRQQHLQLMTKVSTAVQNSAFTEADTPHEIQLYLPSHLGKDRIFITNEPRGEELINIISAFLIATASNGTFHRHPKQDGQPKADRKTAILVVLCVLIPYLVFSYIVDFFAKSC